MADEVTCKCGAVYLEKGTKLPVRDKDSFDCNLCGEELNRWNGGVTYSYKLLRQPDGSAP